MGKGQINGKGPPRQVQNNCGNCVGSRGRRNCPAFGKKCHSCNKPNHFEKMCRSKNVSFVQEESDSESQDSFVISTISKLKKKKSSKAKAATTNLYINKTETANVVKIQIDIGAQCNIPPVETYIKITDDTQLQSIKPCQTEVVSYTGERRNITCNACVKHVGCCQIKQDPNLHRTLKS